MDASIDEVESFTARKSAVDFLEAISKYVEDTPKAKPAGRRVEKGKGKPSSKGQASPCQVVLNYIDRLKHTLQQNILEIAKLPVEEESTKARKRLRKLIGKKAVCHFISVWRHGRVSCYNNESWLHQLIFEKQCFP